MVKHTWIGVVLRRENSWEDLTLHLKAMSVKCTSHSHEKWVLRTTTHETLVNAFNSKTTLWFLTTIYHNMNWFIKYLQLLKWWAKGAL